MEFDYVDNIFTIPEKYDLIWFFLCLNNEFDLCLFWVKNHIILRPQRDLIEWALNCHVRISRPISISGSTVQVLPLLFGRYLVVNSWYTPMLLMIIFLLDIESPNRLSHSNVHLHYLVNLELRLLYLHSVTL